MGWRDILGDRVLLIRGTFATRYVKSNKVCIRTLQELFISQLEK